MNTSRKILVIIICCLGGLQVCCGETPHYGGPCNSDAYCRALSASAKCADKPLHPVCYRINFGGSIIKDCPLPINTTRHVPDPACAGVPDAIKNVRANVSESHDKKTLTIQVSWTPSPAYVGPQVYVVHAAGYRHTDLIAVTKGVTDEETFESVISDLLPDLNFTIYITGVTAAGYKNFIAPVRITTTRPSLPSTMSVIRSYHGRRTSFDIKLCSSCLTAPNQGLVEAAAIIVCDTSRSSKCQSSYVGTDGHRSEIRITKAEDMKTLPTWADAKSHNFDRPYRTTPEDFYQILNEDRTPEIIYTVGGSICLESDIQTFCNGPVPQKSNFDATVVICNNNGCSQSRNLEHQRPTENDDLNSTVTGLAVGLGIALLVCISLAVYIMCSRRSKNVNVSGEKQKIVQNAI